MWSTWMVYRKSYFYMACSIYQFLNKLQLLYNSFLIFPVDFIVQSRNKRAFFTVISLRPPNHATTKENALIIAMQKPKDLYKS